MAFGTIQNIVIASVKSSPINNNLCFVVNFSILCRIFLKRIIGDNFIVVRRIGIALKNMVDFLDSDFSRKIADILFNLCSASYGVCHGISLYRIGIEIDFYPSEIIAKNPIDRSIISVPTMFLERQALNEVSP